MQDILLKMTTNLPPNEKLAPKQPLCFGTHFSKITFYSQTVLQKTLVSQAQSNWFSIREAPTHKRQVRANLHTPDMNRVK